MISMAGSSRARQRAGRKVARSTSSCPTAVAQDAFDVADQVHHVRIALHAEGFWSPSRCRCGRCGRCRCAPGRSASGARRVPWHRTSGRLRAARPLRRRAARRCVPASGRMVIGRRRRSVCFSSRTRISGAGADDLEVAHVVEVHVRATGSANAARGTAPAGFRCSACAGRSR